MSNKNNTKSTVRNKRNIFSLEQLREEQYENMMKNRSKHHKQPHQINQITEYQKHSIAMFFLILLQDHSSEFVKALSNYSQNKLSIIYLYAYISKFYSHLEQIARYYIISALSDYKVAQLKDQKHFCFNVINQNSLINILIEQLAKKYHVEYLWWIKIAHVPQFLIFEEIDQYKKGYISVKEIQRFVRQNIPHQRKNLRIKSQSKRQYKKEKKILKNYKILNNIHCDSYFNNIITIQTLTQIYARINLKEFNLEGMNTERGGQSQSYKKIYGILQNLGAEQINNSLKEEYSLLLNQRQNKELFLIANENYNIKQMADQYVQKPQLKEYSTQKTTIRSNKEYSTNPKIQQSNYYYQSQRKPIQKNELQISFNQQGFRAPTSFRQNLPSTQKKYGSIKRNHNREDSQPFIETVRKYPKTQLDQQLDLIAAKNENQQKQHSLRIAKMNHQKMIYEEIQKELRKIHEQKWKVKLKICDYI